MTTETDPWADLPKGNYVKFENVGDTVVGTVISRGVGRDYDGNPAPEVTLDTADGQRTVTGGQANLKAKLMALNPPPATGDKMRITLTELQPVGKGSPMKVFTIKHETGTPVSAVKAEEIF